MRRSADELNTDFGQYGPLCLCRPELLAGVAGEMSDDVQKLEFTINAFAMEDCLVEMHFSVTENMETWACAMEDPFVSTPEVHVVIRECLIWQTSRSANVIMNERELTTQQIESSGCKFWESGSCPDWFTGTDPAMAFIAREVNGPLCEELVMK